MKALRLNAPHQCELADIDDARPGADETLIRVHSVGVCGSDLHAWHGTQPFVTYPRILGHEVGAEVVEAGPSRPDLKPGDRVVIEPLLSCGNCYPCRIGKYNCCASLRVLGVHTDGALRPYFAVPSKCLHRAPEGLGYEEMAMCETVSIGLHAVHRAAVAPNETVVVIGAGPIGLGAMQSALAYRARVIVLDVLDARLETARQLGATHTVNSTATDPVKAVMDLTDGEGAAAVIEAVGLPKTIEQTVDLVAAGGRIVIVGVGSGTVTFPQHIFLKKEIDFRGSRNSRNCFPEVIRLMAEGKVRMGPLVTHRFGFEEGLDAFRWIDEHRGEVTKAVINVSG